MAILDKIIGAITPPESPEKRAQARAEARACAEAGDWLSLLLDHHERIEAAFAAVKSAADASSRRAAQKQLGALLTGHSMAEEAVVYPAIADAGKTMHADTAYAEQIAAKMQMAALETLDPMGQDYLDKLEHLEGAVGHHVYKEESDWFVDLKKDAPAEVQARVLRRYREEFDRYMNGEDAAVTGAGLGALEARSFNPPLT
jgi:hypothetical protein